jgi:D-cysteine desulfhydrase family pyridoxal phosphate-dependent enzyme
MVRDMTKQDLHGAIAARPRVSLAHLPTPLDEAPRLSERLGVRVLIKRDDTTGLALGGNKARKLEFVLAEALAAGADTIITTGSSQSNHARITAAACNRLGLSCSLVLMPGLHLESQGNLLLDQMLGADVHIIESTAAGAASEAMEALADELRATGRSPYVVPLGASTPVGAVGYAAMFDELQQQLEALNTTATHLYVVSGSCGTQAGILAGVIAIETPMIVQGISVSHGKEYLAPLVIELTEQTLRLLDLDGTVDPAEALVDDGYVGPAYGHPTPGMLEALEIVARDEGILLDPVYTGKAMAGLIDHARRGVIGKDDTVVFLHSGGLPAIFAYNQELTEAFGAVKV